MDAVARLFEKVLLNVVVRNLNGLHEHFGFGPELSTAATGLPC